MLYYPGTLHRNTLACPTPLGFDRHQTCNTKWQYELLRRLSITLNLGMVNESFRISCKRNHLLDSFQIISKSESNLNTIATKLYRCEFVYAVHDSARPWPCLFVVTHWAQCLRRFYWSVAAYTHTLFTSIIFCVVRRFTCWGSLFLWYTPKSSVLPVLPVLCAHYSSIKRLRVFWWHIFGATHRDTIDQIAS